MYAKLYITHVGLCLTCIQPVTSAVDLIV